jgi:hypothetical protein
MELILGLLGLLALIAGLWLLLAYLLSRPPR